MRKFSWLSGLIFCVIIPVIVVCAARFPGEKSYAPVSVGIVCIALVPFFLGFERRKPGTAELVLLAVMVTMTVIGRVIFAPVPGFKPVTALVVITGIYLGGEMGFLTGAMGAFLSNFYFGQGPWTPFQMLTWGLIGFFAGKLDRQMRNNRVLLCIYGALAGAVYSLILDLWSVLWWGEGFGTKRYLAAITTALPYTVLYMVSNVLFLLLLAKPIGKKLLRIRTRYLDA